MWTRFGETLLAEADYVTVSNIALQRRFGGAVLRHARDETLFDPARYDRDQTRGEFGYGAQDRVILFLGTPRAHKGLLDVAEALRRVQDPRLALCVIGRIGDKALSETLATYTDIRLALHPDQPWDRLPELVNMADAVVILQDPDHPIAAYQLPAKLTDALAMGVPVLARTVSPLEDIALARAYLPVPNDAVLDAALRDVAADQIAAQGQAGRTYFLTEMSYAVNAARLDLAYRAAQDARPADTPLLDRTLKLLSRKTGIALGPSARRPPLRRDDAPRDMIFLWKQNDSAIYGRRPDMLAKYMLETGKVRRIIHLDAPIALQELEQQSEAAQQQAAHQGRQIYETVKKRVLRQADTPDFLRRTFLHRGRAASGEAFGQALPPPEAYADFLRALREEAAVQDGPLLGSRAIVCAVYGGLFPLLKAHTPVAPVEPPQAFHRGPRSGPSRPAARASIRTTNLAGRNHPCSWSKTRQVIIMVARLTASRLEYASAPANALRDQCQLAPGEQPPGPGNTQYQVI